MLRPSKHKLSSIIGNQYPTVNEIIVPILDRWEYIGELHVQGVRWYIAALPTAPYQAEPDEYFGLPPHINLSLRYFKLYRLFQPEVVANDTGVTIQLLLKGEGQSWFGENVGIIDHCTIYKKFDGQENAIYSFWMCIEQDMGVSKILTKSTDNSWDRETTDLLTHLGYIPEPGSTGWLSKVMDLPKAN